MRVLVNGLSAAGAKTGIGHYTGQLFRCLREQAPAGAVECFPSPWVRLARSLWGRARPWLERGLQPAGAAPRTGTWRRRALHDLRSCGQSLLTRHFRSFSVRGRYDLYHEPNYIPLASDLPTVATLHDLSVLLHPEWHPADRVLHFERRFRQGLAQCVHFLAISDFGRREILKTLHLRPEQVTRTYMGIRPGLSPLPPSRVAETLHRLGLPRHYLLYLGTIEPRKNVRTLLEAYCSLPSRLREQYPLLLVGGWGWNSADVAEYLDGEARHRGVVHVGYLPDRHLAALYNGARALVFPSFYEGFGLPPLEMMACGGAVLASTAGALVETVGSRAHLVEPADRDGWREALVRVTGDDDWWQALRRDVTHVARPFTWDQCAADTLRVYQSLCGTGSLSPSRRAG